MFQSWRFSRSRAIIGARASRFADPPWGANLDQQLTYEDVLEIVEIIKSSTPFSEFQLKVGDVEVTLRRQGALRTGPAAEAADRGSPSSGAMPGLDTPAPDPATPAPGAMDAWPEDGLVIRSPMVGTFYRAPRPGAPPFVEAGQEVASDTVVCIIEVMKLMNSIPAGAKGVVARILVEDAAPVGFGQPLVVLSPR